MKSLIAGNPVLRRMLFFGIAIVACTGCLSSSAASPSPRSHVTESTSFFADRHPRSAMAVNIQALLEGDSFSAVTDLQNGNGTDAALSEPIGAIRTHALGLNMRAMMKTVVLAQTINERDGLILVAKLNSTTLAEVVNVAALTEGSVYKTNRLYRHLLQQPAKWNVGSFPSPQPISTRMQPILFLPDTNSKSFSIAGKGRNTQRI